MKDRFEPFQRSHLGAFDVREHETQNVDFDRLEAAAQIGVVLSWFVGDKVKAVFGYYLLWEGVAEVFIIPSNDLTGCAKTFLRRVSVGLERIWQDLNLHRMQTASKADDKTDRWMQYLGFHCEGTMVRYTKDGIDYRMWAKVDGTR